MIPPQVQHLGPKASIHDGLPCSGSSQFYLIWNFDQFLSDILEISELVQWIKVVTMISCKPVEVRLSIGQQDLMESIQSHVLKLGLQF